MSINAWFQAADLSSTELGEYDVSRALKLFDDSDWWVRQHELEAQFVQTKQETCPPGIGFTAADKSRTIHVCQFGQDNNMIFYSVARPRKAFGLFSASSHSSGTKEQVTDDRTRQYIRWFFEDNVDALGREFGL